MGCVAEKTKAEVEQVVRNCLKKEKVFSKISYVHPKIPSRREGKKPVENLNMLKFRKQIIESGVRRRALKSKLEKEEEINEKKVITATQKDLQGLMKSYAPSQIENMFYPMTSIGAVVNQEGTTGTGCLIGPNIVLTSAHNCYNEQKSMPLTEISFIPAFIKKLMPQFPGFKAKQIYYPKQYEGAAKDNFSAVCYDYALLILDYKFPGCDLFDEKNNFEFYFGSLGYDFDWESKCSQKENILRDMQLYGYSLMKSEFFLSLYCGDAFIDKYCLLYKFHTLPGISGSPIIENCFQNKKNKYWIRGIHQRDSSRILPETRAALKLNMKMYQNIISSTGGSYLLYTYDLGNKYLSSSDVLHYISKIHAFDIKNNKQPHQIKLDLKYNNIGDEGCENLAKVVWNNLQQVDLSINKIGEYGCQHLAYANWGHIQQLCLNWNNIGDQGCRNLTRAKWDNMRKLDLSINQIGEKGCEYLADSKWDNLQQLNLMWNNINDVGCEHLAKAKWDNLQKLDLHINKISSVGCEHLAKAQWNNMQQLDLRENPIKKEGYRCFSKLTWKIECNQGYKK